MGSLEASNQNEYVGTALQIFDFCGVRSTGTLSVKALMDKISASEKSSNRSEYKHLKNILDPDECNPDIDVTKLTDALHKYSETQKVKVGLEDSFNLKSGGVPQDTDYGISNDGFQLLEELQCELREKSLLTGQLRDQIYYMEQQNEELLSGLTSERDALKAQIVLLREEKQKYLLVSHDYEEACQRLTSIESDFEQARRELDIARKNSKLLQDCVDQLQVDNHSLEEQLLKSKEECHRINEMYASRQAFLLLQNETLKSEHAEITNKYDDQQHVIQKIVQEKSLLEMELKDILNKSDESPRFDRTIDVSYTDEQMLTTLDGLTADSKFGQQQLLDEDSFAKALNDSYGRSTNMTLYDEMRLSISVSPHSNEHTDQAHAMPVTTELNNNCESDKECACLDYHKVNLQADIPDTDINEIVLSSSACLRSHKLLLIIDKLERDIPHTEEMKTQTTDGNSECDKLKLYIDKLEKEVEMYAKKNLIDAINNDSDVEVAQLNELDELSNINNGTQTDIVFDGSCNNCDTLRLCNERLKFEITNANNKEVVAQSTQTLQNDCLQCELFKKDNEKLQLELESKNKILEEMNVNLSRYEENISHLENTVAESHVRNSKLTVLIDYLKSKLVNVDSALEEQKLLLNNLNCEKTAAGTQTDFVLVNTSTQVDQPCETCDRNVESVPRKITSFFWNATKSLFQIFAVLCFCMALLYMYNVTQQHSGRECRRGRIPWNWLSLQDLLDLALRIEYVGEIPM